MSGSAEYIKLTSARSSADLWLRNWRFFLNVTILALADVLAFTVAYFLFRYGRNVPQLAFLPSSPDQARPIDIFVLLAGVFIIVRYVSGDYSRRRLFWNSSRAVAVTLITISMPCFLVLFALPGNYSHFAEFGSWSFLLFAIPCSRQSARKLMAKAGIWTLPTALICDGSRAGDIYGALQGTISLGYDVRWVSMLDHTFVGLDTTKNAKHIPFSNATDLALYLAAVGCDQVVIATDDAQSREFGDLIQRFSEAGLNVSFSPSLRRLPMVGTTTSFFFGRDLLLFQVHSSLRSFPQRLLKRSFDIVTSSAALIALMPFFLVVAAVIKLRYRDVPVFFGQKVVGRDGNQFILWKLSTMRANAHLVLEDMLTKDEALRKEWNATFKLKDDPRILPGIGSFLRRTSLNELPQLYNVLIGDLSLVGPRPVVQRELIQYYGPAAQLYKRVRPGLTGLWQVSGRSDTTYEQRVLYDEWYILNWSFWYDIVILLQTVWVVLLRKGAY